MNLSEMRTRVRIYVDDRNSDRFTSPEITAFINGAQDDIQRTIDEADEFYFTDVETYTVEPDADAWEFTLPATCRKPILVESLATTPPTPCIYVDFRKRHEFWPYPTVDTSYVGRPRYFLRGNKLSIVAPTSSYQIKVWFIKKLLDLSLDNDTSEIPTMYHDTLCLQAAKRAYGSVGRALPQDLADILEKNLSGLIDDVQDRQQQQPKYVQCEDVDD